MTTKFLTIKFAKFPNFIVMDIPRKKNSVFGQFSVNLPLPDPLQNANFINIVVSASLIIAEITKVWSVILAVWTVKLLAIRIFGMLIEELVLRLELPYTGVPRPSGPEIPKKSQARLKTSRQSETLAKNLSCKIWKLKWVVDMQLRYRIVIFMIRD